MNLILYSIFLIFQLLMAGFMVYLLVAFVTGAPFVPSDTKRAKRMVDIANIRKGDTVIDLGSGDGRLLFLAAKKGAHAIGFEINPYLVLYTNIHAYFSLYKNLVHASWKNLWKTDISKADIVFIYLLPWRMEELAAKLKKELRPGSRIVSNSFIFPGWKIEAKDESNHIYVFKIS